MTMEERGTILIQNRRSSSRSPSSAFYHLPGGPLYCIHEPDIIGTKEDFISGAHDNEIARVLMEIVMTEGPLTTSSVLTGSGLLGDKPRTSKIKQKFESILEARSFHFENDGDRVFICLITGVFLSM